jgi:hypothetical protein
VNDRSHLSAHEVTAEGRIESNRRAGNLFAGPYHHHLPLQAAAAVWVWGDAFRQIRRVAFVPAW